MRFKCLAVLGSLLLLAGCVSENGAKGDGGSGGSGGVPGTGGIGGEEGPGGAGGSGGSGGAPGSGGSGGAGDRCGDGIVDPEEECDDGEANSDRLADACRLDCTRARCGDGIVDSGETCDLGVERNGQDQGCSAFCEIEVVAQGPDVSCWVEGGRSRGLVCVDSVANGHFWMERCERNTDCRRDYICLEVMASGPVSVCYPNWCGDAARLGPGTNGEVWERCNAEFGAMTVDPPDGFCRPMTDEPGLRSGFCVKGGRVEAGESCRWVGIRFPSLLCEPGTECNVDFQPDGIECDSDVDCGELEVPSYCDLDHGPRCQPFSECVPLCNAGTAAGNGEAACTEEGKQCVELGADNEPAPDLLGICLPSDED